MGNTLRDCENSNPNLIERISRWEETTVHKLRCIWFNERMLLSIGVHYIHLQTQNGQLPMD